MTEFSGSGDPVRSLELLWRVQAQPKRGPKQRLDIDQIVEAAIGLAGPVSRLSKKALTTYVPHVIETAAAISARLGHRTRIAG